MSKSIDLILSQKSGIQTYYINKVNEKEIELRDRIENKYVSYEFITESNNREFDI